VQDWNPVLNTGNVDVEGRMGDAKNWGLDKERQSLKERRARVESARERGAHMGSRLDGCSAAHGSILSAAPPCDRERERKDGLLRLGTARDAAQRENGECASTGQSETALYCKTWWLSVLGGKGNQKAGGLTFAPRLPFVPASFHWQCKRQGEKIDEQPGTAARWGAAGGLGKSYPAQDVPLWRQVGCSAA
jgi:hypothetical protein